MNTSLTNINCFTIKLQHTCLLANTRSTASLNSSSASILINSSRASPILSLSLLSTTKIRPENRSFTLFHKITTEYFPRKINTFPMVLQVQYLVAYINQLL